MKSRKNPFAAQLKQPSIYIALLIAAIFTYWANNFILNSPINFYFEVTFLQSSVTGLAQLFYDVGAGFREADSATASIMKSDVSQSYRFPLPEGNYRALRFDPIHDGESAITLSNAKIIDANGTILHTFTAQQFIPLQQIQILKTETNTVQFVTVKEANDPIFNLSFTIPFSLTAMDNESVSVIKYIKLLSIFFSTFLISLSLVWYLSLQNAFKSKTFIPHSYAKCYLVAVLAFITAFAIISGYNKHPDEHHHFLAAQYYINNWLPPAIGEPSVAHTYSVYGNSRLDTWGIEYFLAGKVGYLFKPMVDEYIATRFFNVALFFILLAVFSLRSRMDKAQLIPIALLLITPQIWYIFSYTNNDTFPLFLSVLIVSEIIYQHSYLNHFLKSQSVLQFWQGGVLFGIFLGILLLSKQNYYTFLLFIVMWLIYTATTLQQESNSLLKIAISKNLMLKHSFIIIVMLLVFLARFTLDIAVNGESSFSSQWAMNLIIGSSAKSNNKLSAYREKIAAYPFKTSTAKNDLSKTYYGSYLKDKGLKYSELFSKWHWHEISFKSFVGIYNYMSLSAPPFYYNIMAILLSTFILYLIISIILSRDGKLLILMLMALLSIALTIFISTYNSWVNDFQPQGRYLFPIIGILGLLIYQSRFHLHHWVVNGFILSLFWMSVYSFLFVAMRQINN